MNSEKVTLHRELLEKCRRLVLTANSTNEFTKDDRAVLIKELDAALTWQDNYLFRVHAYKKQHSNGTHQIDIIYATQSPMFEGNATLVMDDGVEL